MHTSRLMQSVRRIASLLIALCFLLPLSQCEFNKHGEEQTVQEAHRIYGYDLAAGGVREITEGNVAGGAISTAVSLLVFFLPLALWTASGTKQALAHVLASPLAGYAIYMPVFGFATRPLAGGILLTAAWALLLLSGCVTLAQVLARRRRRACEKTA